MFYKLIMRSHILMDIKSKLSENEAILICSTNQMEYYLNTKLEKSALVLMKNDAYVVTNSSAVIKDVKTIFTKDIDSRIIELLSQYNIMNVFLDSKSTSYHLACLIKENIQINTFTDNVDLRKSDFDEYVMMMNGVMLNEIIDELISISDANTSQRRIKSMFKQLCGKYDISDSFISVYFLNDQNDCTTDFCDNLVFIDCGIKFMGLYSDYTICLNYGNNNKKDIEILHFIEKLQQDIKNKIGVEVSPAAIFDEIKAENASNQYISYLQDGYGHEIGTSVHEEFSLSRFETEKFRNKMFFTIEPLIIFNNKSYRLERTYAFFENKLLDICSSRDLIIKKI